MAEALSGLLLDTTVLIDLPRCVDQCAACVDASREAGETLAVSVISAMELTVGCRNKQEVRQARSLIGEFQMIHVSPRISGLAYEWLQRYAKSHGLLIPDALIGATAAIHGFVLKTDNVKDFSFLPEVEASRPY